VGLFGKLRSNMNHGGVKVQLQAPSSAPADQVIPVTVTITAEDSQTVDGVKAEIKAQAREQGITMGGGQGVGVQSSRSIDQTVAQVESREPFTIGPGETKTVNLQLYLNGNAGGGNPLGQLGNAGGALGGALQTLATVAQNIDHVNYLYSVHASADVEGVRLDPSDKQSIQILPPSGAAQPAQPVIANAVPSQPQENVPPANSSTAPPQNIPSDQPPAN